jgi:four helix bundle protein
MRSKGYKELVVWQKAMDLVVEVYALTKLLPRDEQYGLVNQLRRAVVSIPSNIAEGNSRRTARDYIHFLTMARGSKSEVETQIEICLRLNFVDTKQVADTLDLCEEIGKMLNGLISKLTPNT